MNRNSTAYGLDSAERAAALDLFQTMDKYDYGFIEADDLALFFAEQGVKVSKYQIIEMMTQCGCSDSGVVSF
jgi:Ca2+-binding EF-hand superfamily protein